jgi:GT2 family glycosyltransferase
MKVSVLVVTYNSEKFIDKCLEALDSQTVRPHLIQIVDTGSKSFEYLKSYTHRPDVQWLKAEREAGFCRGNNLGVRHLPSDIDMVILLNPDCFLCLDFVEKAVAYMKANLKCGAYSSLLEKYDIETGRPTGILDSAGIDRRWYGQWHDIGQGNAVDSVLKTGPYRVKALCGALIALRTTALKDVQLDYGDIFDPRFYMYKEDIDLSIRLAQKGWQLWMDPTLTSYHCRGWNASRKAMPRKMRLASARNECVIQWKLKSPIPIVYSALKYIAVKGFDK